MATYHVSISHGWKSGRGHLIEHSEPFSTETAATVFVVGELNRLYPGKWHYRGQFCHVDGLGGSEVLAIIIRRFDERESILRDIAEYEGELASARERLAELDVLEIDTRDAASATGEG